MKPLNLSSVIWITGTAPEIDHFITDAEQKHRAIKIGHGTNIRSQLVRIAKWDNLEGLQGYIVKDRSQGDIEASFLLVQGQVIGLLVEPEKVDRATVDRAIKHMPPDILRKVAAQ